MSRLWPRNEANLNENVHQLIFIPKSNSLRHSNHRDDKPHLAGDVFFASPNNGRLSTQSSKVDAVESEKFVISAFISLRISSIRPSLSSTLHETLQWILFFSSWFHVISHHHLFNIYIHGTLQAALTIWNANNSIKTVNLYGTKSQRSFIEYEYEEYEKRKRLQIKRQTEELNG